MSESNQQVDPCQHNPYPGLRPYEENEQDQFFGRDADTQILLDKILTHRLTLLFAATGVGKSSLLKAAVIPQLKSASGKHLDVVYYNDWVTTPLAGLKAEIAKTVKQSANWPQGTALDESLSLPEFVQFCTLFVRPPLVIMLDQFEELFRYRHKYHKDTFKPFIEELTGLITATRIPVSIVFSMREDFALELNAFKPKLPTLLFENYYRLERLPSGAARQAIVQPLSKLRFSYEPELLEQLLQDLLHNDPDRDLSSLGANDETETVIPPQLQIVCSQLWKMECASPDRTLHLAAYEQAGRAKGLLKNYVGKSLTGFSQPDRRVLSRVFDHLVSIQGTKMPHTINTLAEKTRDEPKYLMKLLDRLASQDVRILRSQQREKQTWYELYHDMYSESINDWNRVQKRKMFWRQFGIWGVAVSCFSLVAYFGTVAYVHSVSHHLRLAPGPDNRVEIFKGKFGWPDPFNQKQFYSETTLFSRDIEADKRFERRNISDYQNISDDLIGYRPLVKRISAYGHTGNYRKAFKLYDKTVDTSGSRQARALVGGLFGIRTQKSFEKIRKEAISEKKTAANMMALSLFEENVTSLPLTNLIKYRILEDGLKSRDSEFDDPGMDFDDPGTHRLLKSTPLLSYKLLEYLESPNQTISSNAAEILGKIVSPIATDSLVKILSHNTSIKFRGMAAEALGNIGDESAVDPLVKMLKVPNEEFRAQAEIALVKIGFSSSLLRSLIKALNDESENKNFRESAASILGFSGDQTVVTPLINALDNKEKAIRIAAASALGKIGDRIALNTLLNLLHDESRLVQLSAVKALAQIGDSAAFDLIIKKINSTEELLDEVVNDLTTFDSRLLTNTLIKLLREGEDRFGYFNTITALGRLGNEAAVEPLIKLLEDSENGDMRHAPFIALDSIGHPAALKPILKTISTMEANDYYMFGREIADALVSTSHKIGNHLLIEALSDDNQYVRQSAARALGEIGSSDAAKPLIKLLSDDHSRVRAVAADALGKIGNYLALEPLKIALEDSNEEVQALAARALGMLGGSGAVKLLVEALGYENELVRMMAVEAHGELRDRIAIPSLIKTLTDESVKIKQSTAETLKKMNDLIAIDHLIEGRMDNSKGFRRASAESLSLLSGISGISYKEKSARRKKGKRYVWHDFFYVERAPDRLSRLSGIEGLADHRRLLLAALNKSAPQKRDQALLQLAQNEDLHTSIRLKAISVLGEEGVNGKQIIKMLRTINPHKYSLKQEIRGAIKSIKERAATKPTNVIQLPSNDLEKKMGPDQLKIRLEELEKEYANWRDFRDSKKHEVEKKDDRFLKNVRSEKAKIDSKHVFDYAYTLSRLKPDEGLKLLNSPLALARQGAYTAFMMRANIHWLEILDKERELNRDNPIFRHSAFRAIDLGLWRLEVLGNKNNDDEYQTLKKWQTKLERDKVRSKRHGANDRDEVLERLQWTTMMMEHTKAMTAKYAKDGWVRDWPENVEPVNQKYPELAK